MLHLQQTETTELHRTVISDDVTSIVLTLESASERGECGDGDGG